MGVPSFHDPPLLLLHELKYIFLKSKINFPYCRNDESTAWNDPGGGGQEGPAQGPRQVLHQEVRHLIELKN